MKRKGFLEIGLILATIIFLLAGFVGCAGADAGNSDTGTETEGYSVEFLTPEIVRVVSSRVDCSDCYDTSDAFSFGSSFFACGNGDAFAEAIKEIGEEYTIEAITPITYAADSNSAGQGSITAEILLRVRLRE